MQEKRTDELDELLEKMKPEQLGDYYKDNKKYMADDKKTFSYYMKDVLANNVYESKNMFEGYLFNCRCL